VQAFPDVVRALRDIGFTGALVVHLQVVVGAVAKQLRAARPEVGERRDELLGRRVRRLIEVDGGCWAEIVGSLGGSVNSFQRTRRGQSSARVTAAR
jgi:hypothetical protein